MKDRADFGRYGKSFQEGFCQLILEDRPFADQISEVLDINFLELKFNIFKLIKRNYYSIIKFKI